MRRGAIWLVGPDGARRVDPASGAAVASPPAQHPYLLDETALWSLATAQDRRCEGSSSSYAEYSPYRVERIDPTTGTVAFGIDLPGTCRYARDNRNPSAELAIGPGAAWVVDPGTCRLFRIDSGRGTVTTVPGVVGKVFGADADGVWLAAGPLTYTGSFPSCAPALGPGLTHVDVAGSVGRTVPLPSNQGVAGISIADGAAWVTSARVGENAYASALARVDLSTGATLTTRISPGSVATGEGRVWFLGRFPEDRRTKDDTEPGLLGEIDPRTGEVERTFQLALGPTRPSAGILAVSGDAVWILTSGSPREILQVAT